MEDFHDLALAAREVNCSRLFRGHHILKGNGEIFRLQRIYSPLRNRVKKKVIRAVSYTPPRLSIMGELANAAATRAVRRGRRLAPAATSPTAPRLSRKCGRAHGRGEAKEWTEP
jgi:hypothetical protein